MAYEDFYKPIDDEEYLYQLTGMMEYVMHFIGNKYNIDKISLLRTLYRTNTYKLVSGRDRRMWDEGYGHISWIFEVELGLLPKPVFFKYEDVLNRISRGEME